MSQRRVRYGVGKRAAELMLIPGLGENARGDENVTDSGCNCANDVSCGVQVSVAELRSPCIE